MSGLPSYHGWQHRPKFVGGTDPLPPRGHFEIKVFADRGALDGNLSDASIIVSTGDGKFVFVVPPDLHGTQLVVAEAGLSAVGSSDVEVTLGNLTTAVDMLTTPITIPAGDFASYPPQATDIDEANAVVSQGDRISVNVDAAGGGDAEGLVVILEFDLV